MTIVMGLDQHRGQITAEWIDLETGEISRGRVVPADRATVRRFLARFAGRDLVSSTEVLDLLLDMRSAAFSDAELAALIDSEAQPAH